MDDDTHEARLQGQQDGRIYPLGRALRQTWDAENHDTLGNDVTGLMIDLSKVPFDPASGHSGAAVGPSPIAQEDAAGLEASAPAPSIMAWLRTLFGR